MILNLYKEGIWGEFLNEIGTKTERQGSNANTMFVIFYTQNVRLCILDAKWRL